MSHLRRILERRDALRAELHELAGRAAADGTFPADVQTRWDALTAEAEGLNAAERRQAVLDDLDRRAAGQPLGAGTGDAHLDRETARVGLHDVIRAQLGATDAAAGRAREVGQELARRSGRSAQGMFWHMGAEHRTLTSTAPAGGAGGNLIATDLAASSFIDRLYPITRVRQLGARVLDGLVGNVAIPRLRSSAATGWVAENSPLTVSDPSFDQVALTPKHAGALVEFSRNMLMQSTPSIDALLQADMARMLALALDTAAIAGTGAANQPRGVLNTAGIGAVALGANGGPLTYASVVDLMGQVQDQNAEAGALAFLSNYRVRRAAAKLVTTAGEPLGEDVVFQGTPRAFTTGVPANLTKGTGSNLSALIYGNWSDLILATWSELDILVNPYESTAYAKGNVMIRALMTCDIAVRHPESFAAITDVAP